MLVLIALIAAAFLVGNVEWEPSHRPQPPGTTAAHTNSPPIDTSESPEPSRPPEPSGQSRPEEPQPPPQPPDTEPVIEQPRDKPAEPAETPLSCDDLLEQTAEQLQQDALDGARQNIDKLKDLGAELTAEQTAALAALELELESRLADRQLLQAVGKLASSDRQEVLAAQNLLFERCGAALPLLRKSVQGDNPLLVRNTLEMLRLLQEPDVTLPIMVGVLGRPQQQENWPDAIREIALASAPGAGEPLLELAAAADPAEQRIAALRALAEVVDPPRQTLTALLPLLLADGPELADALTAATHAVLVHQQQGLLTGRGLAAALSAGQIEQLESLPARLSQIIDADSDPPGPAARAARMLGIACRQIPAEPLAGVRVLAFGSETKDSPAAAVLDGQWNTTEARYIWRHAAAEQGSLVLDLGSERTIAGVRIWNLNESPGGAGGWKEVAVYVGSDTAALAAPVARGIVPQAPGKADQSDYSTMIPLDFVPGRYVRLRAASHWRNNKDSGLTEVQVLGF